MTNKNNLTAFIYKNYYYIFLAIFLIWMGIGCFPLYCYESDSMHTILGFHTVYAHGFDLPPLYSYEYNMQPLLYVVVPCLKFILPFFNIEQIFCLLTAIAAMINIILCIELVYKLTKINRLLILFATFLLPESVAIGMYPNTAIFAILFVVIALHLLLKKKFILSTLFLIIAPTFRIDVVMIYPVVMFILWWRGYSFWKSLKVTVIMALVIVTGIVIAYYLLQANPLTTTLNKYESWNNTISLKQNFVAIYTYYTICNLILVPIGIYLLVKNRNIKLLCVMLVPIVLNHIVYAKMGCATKHFAYMMPFTIALSASAIQYLKSWLKIRLIYKYTIIILLVLYLCVSIRFTIPTRPWYSKAQQIPCIINIFNEEQTKYQVSMGIGSGRLLTTNDELMLASGNLFYPVYINQYKAELLAKRNHMYQYMKDKTNVIYLGSSWENQATTAIAYINNGYSLSTNEKLFSLEKNNDKVSIILDQFKIGGNAETQYNLWDQAINNLKKGDHSLYCFALESTSIYFLDQLVEKGIIKELTENLYFIENEHSN